MYGVWYAAIGAVFVLGLLAVYGYSKGRPTAGAGHPDAEADAGRVGEAQAASLRRVAQAEADAVRRAAETEADATRQAAQAHVQGAHAEAETVRATAASQAEEIRAQARRAGAEEAASLTEQLRRTQTDLNAQAVMIEQSQARLEAEANRRARDSAELDQALHQLGEQRAALDATAAELQRRSAELERRSDELAARRAEHEGELERVAGLSTEQARSELLAGVAVSSRREAAILVRSIENEARTEGTERARAIVVEAVQRVAAEQTAESVVSLLHLPSEEMKGRIIGREGRNIRSFESVTGVNVIIDDTPEAVLLSCFDPVRREVGRLTLSRLVLDGRIHPHRIEEAYEQSRAEVDALCLRAARDAIAEVGVGAIDERLLPTLGRLKYRTSYGQNVLAHLVETAHIAGIMAAELGIEATLVKRCAFLHDIGKALTHEVEGSHAIVGAALLRSYGEDEAVAHAVEAHHNEVQPRTIEAVLTQASDTCSASRPGARRESLENYVKRLQHIEQIANAKPGVDKVFAMQSGREVRVMVQPSEVDDLAAQVIAREIAKQIEDELTYPGQIRVTVVRESRSTEIAH
ncbi:MAG: ribonuclease Y [Jatrophihabitantaceae bacterium]